MFWASGPQRLKLLANREYFDIVMSKFVTIGFLYIFAGLGLSDISVWPTGCTVTSSCANS